MKIKVLLVGILLLASTSAALAAGPYIGLAGGVTIAHDADMELNYLGDKAKTTIEYDSGFAINASAGYDFQPVRVEFEFGYKKNDIDTVAGWSESGDITVMSYMLNVLYDFNTYSRFTPYVGAGIGLLDGEIESGGAKASDTEFGYQAIIGAAFHVDTHFAFDLSYRFLHAPSDFSLNGVDIEYDSSNIMLGARVKF